MHSRHFALSALHVLFAHSDALVTFVCTPMHVLFLSSDLVDARHDETTHYCMLSQPGIDRAGGRAF